MLKINENVKRSMKMVKDQKKMLKINENVKRSLKLLFYPTLCLRSTKTFIETYNRKIKMLKTELLL